MGGSLQRIGRSASPAVTVISRHGLALLSLLVTEALVYGFLRLGFLPPESVAAMNKLLYWASIGVVIIFCTETLALLLLNAYEEIRARWGKIRDRKQERPEDNL